MAVILGKNHTWLMWKILNGQSKGFIGKPKVWTPATQPLYISTPPVGIISIQKLDLWYPTYPCK